MIRALALVGGVVALGAVVAFGAAMSRIIDPVAVLCLAGALFIVAGGGR